MDRADIRAAVAQEIEPLVRMLCEHIVERCVSNLERRFKPTNVPIGPVVQDTARKRADCPHRNMQTIASGAGRCVDCGKVFDDGRDC